MILPLSITIREPIRLPVEVIEVDGLPKIIAGGTPVTPLNVALKLKVEERGATEASIETYSRAGRLYSEFAARRERSLIDVTDEEFRWFVQALQDRPFPGGGGQQQTLPGERGARTANLMVTLIYSLAAEMQNLYRVKFDWYRYRGVPNELVDIVRAVGGHKRAKMFRRAHRVPHTPRKVLPLP